jgi:WD40 repeat protein
MRTELESAVMTERDIFLAALDIACPRDRAAYVAQACADDPALRQRLDAMLAFHDQEDSFLRAPCGETRAAADDVTMAEGEGTLIGRYKLLEKIGEGGFAVVFMAEQTEPIRRKVALKVIKPGMDSKQVIGRFEAERQALALMDHPNIAKVFDGGVTDSGRPYFVMELVNGVPLTDYCDTFKLDTNQRLAVFMQTCRAVQHAHQKGIIHRDLKPSNVLVTLHDDIPVPKVIDFGIAKATQDRLTERTVFTRFQHFIGTPAYMSPEQATFSGLDIDTRSDIYSLGVLLYELLTGVTPFDKQKLCDAAYDELCRIIRDEQPPTPSTRISTLGEKLKLVTQNRRTDPRELRHTLHRDLDWIVMKALEKERSRRYETASAMADDIERFLHHEPVLAGPPGTMYRLRKAVQRNRGKVAAAVAISLAMLLGSVVSSVSLMSAVRARNDALDAKTVADVARNDEAAAHRIAQQEVERKQLLLYVADTSNAKQAWDAGNVDYAVELLKRHIPKADETDLRTFAWYHMWDQCRQYEASLTHGSPLHALAYSPDGKVLATAGEGGHVTLWDSTKRQPLVSLPVAMETAMSLVFSPDGNVLAIGGGSGHKSRTAPGVVEIWDWQRRKRLRSLSPASSLVACVAMSAQGDRLACSNYDGVLHIWDLNSSADRPLTTIQQPGRMTLSIGFSPDGRTLVAGSWLDAHVVRLWDVRSGAEVGAVKVNGPVRCVAIAPDGKTVAAGTQNPGAPLSLITLTTEEIRTLPVENCVVESIVFSPNGQQLFVGNWKGSIHVFDVRSANLTATFKGHSSVLAGIALAPDRKTIASCSHDRTVKLWATSAATPAETLAIGHESDAPWMRFSHNSKLLASSSMAGSVRLWEAASGKLLETCQEGGEGARGIAFSLDDRQLAWTDGQRAVEVLDLVTGRRRSLTGLNVNPRHLTFSNDGQFITVTGYHARSTAPAKHGVSIKTWNIESGQLTSEREMLAAIELTPQSGQPQPGFPRFRHASGGPDSFTRVSLDGRLLAAGYGSSVRLWDMATGNLRILMGHSEFVMNLIFSPKEEVLASCSQDKSIILWNTESAERLKTLVGRTWPTSLAFSPDGTGLASGDIDGKVTLWDLRTYSEILSLDADGEIVTELAFSDNGQTLACGTMFGAIRLWRAPRQ